MFQLYESLITLIVDGERTKWFIFDSRMSTHFITTCLENIVTIMAKCRFLFLRTIRIIQVPLEEFNKTISEGYWRFFNFFDCIHAFQKPS